jgi:alkyldihydroxyacetonephosphate synthase
VSILELDQESLLVHVRANERFADVETALMRQGLTLDVSPGYAGTIGTWLATGALGARSAWLDPADHLVAGFTAVLPGRPTITIRPAPRRAIGPDLLALVLGIGSEAHLPALESVWLRVHRVGVARPACEAFRDDTEPLTDDERSLYRAIEDALG